MNHKKDIWDIFGIEIGCHKFSNSYYIVDHKDISDSSGFRRWMFETLAVNNHMNESAQLRDWNPHHCVRRWNGLVRRLRGIKGKREK